MIEKNPPRDIYVATIIDSHNYGTVLQAVATRDVLSHYGMPLFIDYCRLGWTRRWWIHSYLSRTGNRLINTAKLITNIPIRLRQEHVFRSFVEKELQLVPCTPFIEGSGTFDENAIYCVGSDQTWNLECNYGIDPVYFLVNVPDTCEKVAFSASFGRPSLDEEELRRTRPLLKGFKAISVRESSSISILESMGIRGGVALKDPVLLCRPSLWDEISADIRPVEEEYVLVYMLNQNPRMCEYARLVAEELGVEAKIVMFNPFKRAPSGLQHVYLPTPAEWVALFRDAGYVVTDSFHGTCFSLLFEKPMTVFDPPRFSVRLTDVLSDFGLSGRRAGDEPAEVISVHREQVDWAAVGEAKGRFRAEARGFLDSCLMEVVE